jgi:RNA polymerase sigma-70 factor, ECF subfamily
MKSEAVQDYREGVSQLDDLLIEAAKEDPAAFADLVRRHQDALFNFLYRMTGNREDAEDLTQEAFVRIYRALPRFRPGSPFKPWMYKIATNLAINQYHARKPTSQLADEFPSRSPFTSPELMAELRETQRDLRGAMLQLPEQYRAILLLRHLNELSYQDIADTLGVPIGTAKVRLHRARKMLQTKMYPDRENHDLRPSERPTSAVS